MGGERHSRDNDDGSVDKLIYKVPKNLHFGLGIKAGCWLVEDDDFGLFEEQTSKFNTLLFTTRKGTKQ